MSWLSSYSLFLAKGLTLLLLVGGFLAILALLKRERNDNSELEVRDLSEEFTEMRQALTLQLANKGERKALAKQYKEESKALKENDPRPRLFVLDFKGGMEAKEVASLRDEISAVIAVAREKDEVLVRLESGGGVVHGYGLAAAQLQRLRDKEIPLTVAVDKVAASGGYMMACVADRVLAAPFAIIGSIGVVAQLPNFNKLLKKHDIDYEMHTAGAYKRTLTMFGENDEAGREKFREELAEIHQQFKEFVSAHRPQLDIEAVTTGEHWLAHKAQELKLVDELITSDDYLMSAAKTRHIVALRYQKSKSWLQKLSQQGAEGVISAFQQWLILPWR